MIIQILQDLKRSPTVIQLGIVIQETRFNLLFPVVVLLVLPFLSAYSSLTPCISSHTLCRSFRRHRVHSRIRIAYFAFCTTTFISFEGISPLQFFADAILDFLNNLFSFCLSCYCLFCLFYFQPRPDRKTCPPKLHISRCSKQYFTLIPPSILLSTHSSKKGSQPL